MKKNSRKLQNTIYKPNALQEYACLREKKVD